MPAEKVTISIRVTPELLDQIDAIRAAQLIPPSRAAVLEHAIQEFADRHRTDKKKKG